MLLPAVVSAFVVFDFLLAALTLYPSLSLSQMVFGAWGLNIFAVHRSLAIVVSINASTSALPTFTDSSFFHNLRSCASNAIWQNLSLVGMSWNILPSWPCSYWTLTDLFTILFVSMRSRCPNHLNLRFCTVATRLKLCERALTPHVHPCPWTLLDSAHSHH